MRALITLSLVCCLVLAMTAPVSAGDYYLDKDVNATDMVDELITYVKYNSSIVDWGRQLSRHRGYEGNENKKGNTFDLNFTCFDTFYVFLPTIFFIPMPSKYHFAGEMHVKDKRKLTQKYTLTITDEDTKITATGENWWLEVWDISETRFKV